MPPKIPLEPYKEEIQALWELNLSHIDIHRLFNAQQCVRQQPTIGLRTLQTQLRAWGFSRQINLEEHIDMIFDAFEEGKTHNQILQ